MKAGAQTLCNLDEETRKNCQWGLYAAPPHTTGTPGRPSPSTRRGHLHNHFHRSKADRAHRITAASGDLAAEEIAALRTAARAALLYGDTELITSLSDTCVRESADRLYGPGLVRYALRLAHVGHHVTIAGTQR